MVWTLANQLTLCRLLLAPVFVATVLWYSPQQEHLRLISLIVFVIAALIDVLDGYIARKFDQITKLGMLLDPLADKILMISAFVCLYHKGVFFGVIRFPFWLVLMVVGRDMILLGGAILIKRFKGAMTILPTIWGKMTLFLEVAAVIGVLLQWHLSYVIWYVLLLFIFISGADYFIKGIKVLNNKAGMLC